MSEKRPTNDQKLSRLRAVGVEQPQNQERAASWATCHGSKRIPGAPSPFATRHFLWFQPSESPTETPRRLYQWSLSGAGGQPGLHMVGANGGSTGVPGAKKIICSKDVPRLLGMLKQVILAHFEPVVTRFGPWKIPKCLQNGPFWDQN